MIEHTIDSPIHGGIRDLLPDPPPNKRAVPCRHSLETILRYAEMVRLAEGRYQDAMNEADPAPASPAASP